jgi:phage FluMu protein Com
MKIKCGFCNKVGESIEKATFARYQCTYCNNVNEVTNVDLKEWLGFNYTTFLSSIEQFITHDQFEALRANTELEKEAGKFSEVQIEKLKDILKISFKEGYSIRKQDSKGD